jgi:hypothetical protein
VGRAEREEVGLHVIVVAQVERSHRRHPLVGQVHLAHEVEVPEAFRAKARSRDVLLAGYGPALEEDRLEAQLGSRLGGNRPAGASSNND